MSNTYETSDPDRAVLIRCCPNCETQVDLKLIDEQATMSNSDLLTTSIKDMSR